MKRNVLGILLAGAIGAAPYQAGCGAASSGTARSSAPQQTQESAPEDGDAGKSAADTPDLTGHTLMIYCGAGMTKPFQEIADSFKAATGCRNERDIRQCRPNPVPDYNLGRRRHVHSRFSRGAETS